MVLCVFFSSKNSPLTVPRDLTRQAQRETAVSLRRGCDLRGFNCPPIEFTRGQVIIPGDGQDGQLADREAAFGADFATPHASPHRRNR